LLKSTDLDEIFILAPKSVR